MIKKLSLIPLFFVVVGQIIFIFAPLAEAQTSPSRGLLPKILPSCQPELPPSNPAGCGLDDFILLVKNIITYLMYIVIPIAAIMMIWAAYVMITAGGSTEKVKKGKAIITTAIIGIVITLAGGILVGLIYKLITGQNPPNIP